jgi:hypothetical protein
MSDEIETFPKLSADMMCVEKPTFIVFTIISVRYCFCKKKQILTCCWCTVKKVENCKKKKREMLEKLKVRIFL